MGEVIDLFGRPFRVVLDDGEVIESTGGRIQPRYSDIAVPELVLRMPAARAHWLAHLLDEWSRALGLSPPKGWGPAERTLGRTLEAAAAALGDVDAMRCTARVFDGVSAPQRLAAAAVLAEREPDLTAVQRISVVDAAARWLNEEAGDQLALGLLTAVCRSDTSANFVYLALLTPDGGPGTQSDRDEPER
jgi:hypothetical protein